jgi:hypothetical protein
MGARADSDNDDGERNSDSMNCSRPPNLSSTGPMSAGPKTARGMAIRNPAIILRGVGLLKSLATNAISTAKKEMKTMSSSHAFISSIVRIHYLRATALPGQIPSVPFKARPRPPCLSEPERIVGISDLYL